MDDLSYGGGGLKTMLTLDQLSMINHDESGIIDQDAFNYYELMSNQGKN